MNPRQQDYFPDTTLSQWLRKLENLLVGMSTQSASVFIRIRPVAEGERQPAVLFAGHPRSRQLVLDLGEDKHQFQFDRVLRELLPVMALRSLRCPKHSCQITWLGTCCADADATQRDVFAECASTVDAVLCGRNGSIFLYGQTGMFEFKFAALYLDFQLANGSAVQTPLIITGRAAGSGKTYTLFGSLDAEGAGLVPRAVAHMGVGIASTVSTGQAASFQVTVSVCEVYCERVRCLLNGSTPGNDNLQIKACKEKGVYVEGKRRSP
jgi:hypothetical protein